MAADDDRYHNMHIEPVGFKLGQPKSDRCDAARTGRCAGARDGALNYKVHLLTSA